MGHATPLTAFKMYRIKDYFTPIWLGLNLNKHKQMKFPSDNILSVSINQSGILRSETAIYSRIQRGHKLSQRYSIKGGRGVRASDRSI